MISTAHPSLPQRQRKSQREKRVLRAEMSLWTRVQTRETTTTTMMIATRYGSQRMRKRPKLTKLQELEFIIDKPATAPKPAA
jgi:hypothetical protein